MEHLFTLALAGDFATVVQVQAPVQCFRPVQVMELLLVLGLKLDQGPMTALLLEMHL